MSHGVLKSFYNSKQWKIFRQQIILDRTQKNGGIKCEYCGKLIISSSDIEVHHTPVELTELNYLDVSISLNPKNVKIACKKCHNKQHNRFCKGAIKKPQEYIQRGIYLIYGPPCSGKSKYVREHSKPGDLIVDMDKLFYAVSGCEMYDKPNNLRFNVFGMQNLLLDNIKTRYGKFNSAFIVGGYADKFKREKIANDLGATLVFMEESKETCITRLDYCNDYRQSHKNEWIKYIEEWFDKYS